MGGRRRLERAIRLLREGGVPVAEIRWTRERGDAEVWAREAVGRGVDLVIASGGDGTLNEIVNGLAGSDVAMGILPAGTANVVACELAIPRHPVAGARVILEGKRERVHLGHAKYRPIPSESKSAGVSEDARSSHLSGRLESKRPTEVAATYTQADAARGFRIRADKSDGSGASLGSPAPTGITGCQPVPHPAGGGEPVGRYFLFAAGLGFDAYICFHLNTAVKKWTRKGAYVIYGLRQFCRYRSPEIHVSLDGGPAETCSMAVFSNTCAYAGSFPLAPHASLKKPCLDVNLFLGRRRLDLIRYVWGILRGRHTTYPDVRYESATEARIEAAIGVYLHLDGDAVGTPPARIRIVPDALTIITPSDWHPAGPPEPGGG